MPLTQECDSGKHVQAGHRVQRQRVQQLPRYYNLLSNLNISQIRSPKELNLQHVKNIRADTSELTYNPPEWRHQFHLDATKSEVYGETFLLPHRSRFLSLWKV